MKAAFYKAKGGPYNYLVRAWERGDYSHVELVFSDGKAASASFLDKGVRFKNIDFTSAPDNWDMVDLPSDLETAARKWFVDHNGQPYNLLGQMRFVVSPIPVEDKDKWWCSEAVAAALGMPDSWRYGPNGLYDALKAFVGMEHM